MTKILVIEDEALLRMEVSDWLMFEGYEVFEAGDGAAGVNAAIQNLPDVIICDITMPRLDGYGVLLELHSNSITAGIPFIFMTARATHEDVRKGMAAGADDYITKPFTRIELFDAIQSRLEKKSLLEQDRQQEIDQLQYALAEEREQRLMKAKLVAMFSHDFRNPLGSIMSSNMLLRDYGDRLEPNRRLTHLNRIDASVRRLLQMLDDMLLVTQMDSGKLNFKAVTMSPEQLFGQIVEEFQAIYSETHQITFESRFSEETPADARLLRAIATNLISNAVKYSPRGTEVQVFLSSKRDQFILTVQDYGIGIPEEDQARLFSAFQRASNVGDVSGTGLGLAIVKQAAEQHGGSVYLRSQVNSGTSVTVAIPLAPSN